MIITTVDRLLQLLEEKRQTTVSEAARILGADEKQIEKIANYLMEEDVISVDYKLGGIEISLGKKERQAAKELMLDKARVKKGIVERFGRKKKKKKKVPRAKEEALSRLIKEISKKDITEREIDRLRSTFQDLVADSMKDHFYNKDFLNTVCQFFELIESKKIAMLMSRYKKENDKKAFAKAKALYKELEDFQQQLSKKGYPVNDALREQVKKTIAESGPKR